MAADLVFYTNPASRGRIVRWMLEEVGCAYDTEIVDYASTMKAEPYLSINPMGKVPAIVHKGRVVTECAATAPISPMLSLKPASRPRSTTAPIITAGCSSPPVPSSRR
jgi:hypothetical protein